MVTVPLLSKSYSGPTLAASWLKKGLMEIDSGNVIKIIATDPAAHLDIGVYTEQTGHPILEFLKEGGKQIFFIEKK